MTQRVFLKLVVLIVVVVGVSTILLDLTIRRNWASLPKELLLASAISLFIGIVIALIAARGVTARLQKIKTFAQEISAGNFSARLPDAGTDEIGAVASTLDATARRLEANFLNLESNREQLETLLNSMNDSVMAARNCVVQWRHEEIGVRFPLGGYAADSGGSRSRSVARSG